MHDGTLTLQLNFAIWNLTLTLFTFPAIDIENVCRGKSLNTAQLCSVMHGHMANSVYSRRSHSPKPSNCAIKHVIKTADESIQEVMRNKYFSVCAPVQSPFQTRFLILATFKILFQAFLAFHLLRAHTALGLCSCDCEGQLKGTPQSVTGGRIHSSFQRLR